MSDVHAEHAPEALMDPADPWGTLGAHVVEAKGARGARAPFARRGVQVYVRVAALSHTAWHRRL